MMIMPPPMPGRLLLRLASDPQAVRNGLRDLLASQPLRDLDEDLRGSVEIVLAEVLNNIVEHAYAGSAGQIEVTLVPGPSMLWIEVADSGCAMPSETLPAGDPAEVTLDDLPEGGFGWFLIRSLTQDLVYTRKAGRNTLCFRMSAE